METTPVKSRSIRSPTGVEMVYANDLYCTYCPMVFASVSGRKRHEMYHEGRRSHTCEVCHVSFYRGDRLSNHKYICRTISSFGKTIKWCSFCDNFFRTDRELRKHYGKIHGMQYYEKDSDSHQESKLPKAVFPTDARVFSCELCASTFSSAFFLGRHKYTVHKIKSSAGNMVSSNDNYRGNGGGSGGGGVVGSSERQLGMDDEMEQLREAREIGLVGSSEEKPFLGFP